MLFHVLLLVLLSSFSRILPVTKVNSFIKFMLTKKLLRYLEILRVAADRCSYEEMQPKLVAERNNFE